MTVAKVEQGSVQQALAAYRSRADVAWAEPDYIYRATLTTTDPSFPSQWGPLKIGAPIAWDVTTGSAATYVAILDSGVFSETASTYLAPDGQPGHPDLRGKVVSNANFTTATTGADDWYGHGTLMAGIAGAKTNAQPAEGIAGIGFDTRLFNGKVLGDDGSGFESWVAEGIVWAADSGAHVISMSLGGPGACSQTMQDAVDYAWNKGLVIVAAAGNGGDDQVGDPAPESPGNCAHVIAVGAIDQADGRASFSNYGPAVPLAAPGVSILSTNYVGTYSTVSGTSPATPHVAGVAALLRSTPFGPTHQAIVDRLLQTADPIVGTGSVWGYGRVNAAAAVGPASCSPRPKVTITSTPSGGLLDVTATVTGVGNAVRYVQTGTLAGQTINAVVSFPTQASQAGGTTTYVPANVGASATFQMDRQVPGLASTLPFIVTDGCGTWNSLAGGGAAAGF
jgi:thermitase